MAANNNELWNDEDSHSEQHDDDRPRGYRVDDDDNLEEKDLKRSFLFGGSEGKSATAPNMEGQGTGGEKFGQNNLTPSGDDKANPSQNAGNRNAYFKRTEPSEEHPENSNFKAEHQSGTPDYSQAQPRGNADSPAPEKKEEKDINTYQEGTADNDGETNIPGPNEVPDQQKVGEDNNSGKDEKYHVET
ncbi:MAG TPA: hypothetical protein VK668_03630 [Mucilaginibacter sp.]|nr:hypothetical protein [Mucilaginibacter sp.]